jgi:hypothetical protein
MPGHFQYKNKKRPPEMFGPGDNFVFSGWKSWQNFGQSNSEFIYRKSLHQLI